MPSFFNTIIYRSHCRKAGHYRAITTAFYCARRTVVDSKQWPSLIAIDALLIPPQKFATPHSSNDYLFTLDFSTALYGIATPLSTLMQQHTDELLFSISQMSEKHKLSPLLEEIHRVIPIHQKRLCARVDWDSAATINPIIALLNCTYWFLREMNRAQIQLVPRDPSCTNAPAR